MSEVEEEIDRGTIIVPGPAAIPIPIGLIDNMGGNQSAQFTNTSATPITPNLSVNIGAELTLLTGPPATLPTGQYTYSVLFNNVLQTTQATTLDGYQVMTFPVNTTGTIMITAVLTQGQQQWQGNFLLKVISTTHPLCPLQEDANDSA